MKIVKFRIYRNEKTLWCNAVHPRKVFLGWNENSIHINLPLYFASLVLNINKPI